MGVPHGVASSFHGTVDGGPERFAAAIAARLSSTAEVVMPGNAAPAPGPSTPSVPSGGGTGFAQGDRDGAGDVVVPFVAFAVVVVVIALTVTGPMRSSSPRVWLMWAVRLVAVVLVAAVVVSLMTGG